VLPSAFRENDSYIKCFSRKPFKFHSFLTHRPAVSGTQPEGNYNWLGLGIITQRFKVEGVPSHSSKKKKKKKKKRKKKKLESYFIYRAWPILYCILYWASIMIMFDFSLKRLNYIQNHHHILYPTTAPLISLTHNPHPHPRPHPTSMPHQPSVHLQMVMECLLSSPTAKRSLPLQLKSREQVPTPCAPWRIDSVFLLWVSHTWMGADFPSWPEA